MTLGRDTWNRHETMRSRQNYRIELSWALTMPHWFAIIVVPEPAISKTDDKTLEKVTCRDEITFVYLSIY